MAQSVPPGVSYKSDRWFTPGVLIALIITSGLVLAVITAGVAYLTARGLDPDPMLKLVATVGTGVIALVNVALTVAGRTTATKTERNTGVLAGNVASVAGTVYEVADQLSAAPRATGLPPVPPAGRTSSYSEAQR